MRERAAHRKYKPWDMGSYNYDLIKARYYEMNSIAAWRCRLPAWCWHGRHSAGPFGAQRRQEHRLRPHHPAGRRLLLLLAAGRADGAPGEDVAVVRLVDGQHLPLCLGLFLLWRVDRMPIEIAT